MFDIGFTPTNIVDLSESLCACTRLVAEIYFFFNTFLQSERHALGDGFGGRWRVVAGGDVMGGAGWGGMVAGGGGR